MTAPDVGDRGDVAVDLTRWAVQTEHHSARDRGYPLTEHGDYAAWLDRLSGQIAGDQAAAARATRRDSGWRPRPHGPSGDADAL